MANWILWVFLLTVGAEEPDFTGLWVTDYGRVRLEQRGTRLTGSYIYVAEGGIEGRVNGDQLLFSYREPESVGVGEFTLSEDKRSFEGRWRPEGSTEWKKWTGQRVEPRPEVIWLIILEARWEGFLAEKEFSFGEMLRTYFTMEDAQHVEIRHRFFHDADDFRRFTRETAYLAEPVILLVSTHGTKNGILVGGNVIGPAMIGEAVRGNKNIMLLHLSGCDMMDDKVPRRIMTALPAEDRFPISGYTTTVDWAASAIADFIYLSMLLIQKLEPAEAVAQTHRAAPYTGKAEIEDCAFDSLGLEILTPDRLEKK